MNQTSATRPSSLISANSGVKVTDHPIPPSHDATEAATKLEQEGLSIEFSNADEAKSLFKDFDDFRRYRLGISSAFFDKVSGVISAGTALFEKLILLDGATIALSMTFLGSLSSRLAGAHVSERPHLWMVGVSWLLLIASVYFSYRVILRRHSATLRLLSKASAEHTTYFYQRLGVLVCSLGNRLRGAIETDGGQLEAVTISDVLLKVLEKEGADGIKRMTDFVSEGEKSSREGIFARLAVCSTILAVALLCLFTVLSLRLLFQ